MTKVNFVRIIAMGTSTLLECMCQKCVHPKLFTVIPVDINSEGRTMKLSQIKTILHRQNVLHRILSSTCCYLEEAEEELML